MKTLFNLLFWFHFLALVSHGGVNNFLTEKNDTLRGIVFHDKNGNGIFNEGIDTPLSGVAVSNGSDIVLSDKRGKYILPVRRNQSVFLIKPSHWTPALSNKNVPQFFYMHYPDGATGTKYQGFRTTGSLPENFNFPLYPSQEPDRFDVLVFGDTQPRSKQEVYYLAGDLIPEVIGIDAAFGVTLGDIVFDDLDIFEPLTDVLSTIKKPWFYVLGNHDIDFTADTNIDARGAWYRTFGPSWYSFSYGPAHFIVLDNIQWIVEGEQRYYRTGLGKDQMLFLHNELNRIGKDKLIVLLTHIPWAGSTPWADEKERADFFALISQYPASFSLAAHTHRHYHHLIGKSHTYQIEGMTEDFEKEYKGINPHHMISIGATCGAWWSGAPDEYGIPHSMMSDGTPTSYAILHIDGKNWKLGWRASRRPSSFQMQVHAPETIKADTTDVLVVSANVFNALPDAKVEMRIGDEGEWIKMNKVHKYDPFRYDVVKQEISLENIPWRRLGDARISEQIWETRITAIPTPGAHVLHVRSKDNWFSYEGKRLIYVW